jgi:hypothetical protein
VAGRNKKAGGKMTRFTLKAEELTPETRATLGIKLVPPVEKMSRRHLALGHVLKAIRDLDEEDVFWVLREAKMLHSGQGQIEKEEQPSTPISQVIEVVARHFGVSLIDIIGRRRLNSFVKPRHVAMYLLWSSQVYSLREIGKELGGRTPATVSNGFNLIARSLKTDIELKRVLEEIKRELK